MTHARELSVGMHTPALAGPTLNRILDAIGGGEVHPHYQPIVSLETGEMVGVEALARWDVPDTGLLAANAFVPVLERSRRVSVLTAFMLHRACADLAAWRRDRRLVSGFRVAVNVSATEVGDRRLAGLVHEALDAHEVAPQSLCLELTETAPIEDLDAVGAVLAELTNDIGVQLAVDDYGTGHNDSGVLGALPFDTVKIDRSFVTGMGHRADHAAFVRATVGYAANRSLSVVAEGVRDRRHAQTLLRAGCRFGQGFGLGVPCPADRVLAHRRHPVA